MSGSHRTYVWLLALSMAGFVASFATQLLISYHFGTSQALDAYLAAVALLNLFGFYVHPIREALVPGFHRRVTESPEAGHAYFTQGFALVALLAVPATAALLLMPSVWASFVTDPNDAALHARVTATVRVLAPALLLLAVSEVLNALLSSYRRVLTQQAARLLGALSVLACVGLLAGAWGALALVYAFIAGQAVMAAGQAVLLARLGLRLRLHRERQLDRAFFAMAAALVLSYACGHAYFVLEKKTLIGFGEGWVSAMHYGTALVNVMVSIFGVTVANLLAPQLLDAASRGDAASARRAVSQGCAFLLLVLGPIALIGSRQAQPVIELVFTRGAFGAASLAHTTEAFRATIFALLPVALMQVLTRALLSQRAARVMAAVGIAAFAAGSAVLLVASQLGTVHVALLHWLIGNTIGLALAAALFYRRHAPDGAAVRRAVSWSVRWALVMAATYALTPRLSLSWPGKPGVAADVALDFVLVIAVYAVACAIAGLMREALPAALPFKRRAAPGEGTA